MIDSPSERSRILEVFGFLARADRDFQTEFFRAAAVVSLSAGETIGRQGELCSHLALVLSGTARVYRLGENGREITLYRIRPGESCVLTASCILRQGAFPAFAECETDVGAVLVGQGQVERWVRERQPWRDFVFGLVSERLLEVIELLDAVLFERLETRLARRLLELSEGPSAEVAVTHQSLAAELGSSREVVSRLLAALEDRRLLKTRRGHIRILESEGLAVLGRGT